MRVKKRKAEHFSRLEGQRLKAAEKGAYNNTLKEKQAKKTDSIIEELPNDC